MEAILISFYNMYFDDKVKKKKKKKPLKIILNICIYELSEEFLRDSKTSSNQPW